MKIMQQILKFANLVQFWVVFLLLLIYFQGEYLKKQIFAQSSAQSLSNFNVLIFFAKYFLKDLIKI